MTPFIRFLPAVTRTVIRSGLPSALIILGETVSAMQGSDTGGFGFGVGGGFVVGGAGTTVTAESELSAGFVSRPPEPVTVAVFVCEPTAVARAVIAMVTVWPGAIVPSEQVTSAGPRLHVPCDGVAVR